MPLSGAVKQDASILEVLKILNEQRKYGPEITREHIRELLYQTPTYVYVRQAEEELIDSILEEQEDTIL